MYFLNRRKWDFGLGLVFLITSILLYVVIIPWQVHRVVGFGIDAFLYPRFLAVVLGIFSLILMGGAILRLFRGGEADKIILPDRQASLRLLVVMLISLAYSVEIELFGFKIATGLTCILLLLFLGERSWVVILAAPILIPLSTYYLFTRL